MGSDFRAKIGECDAVSISSGQVTDQQLGCLHFGCRPTTASGVRIERAIARESGSGFERVVTVQAAPPVFTNGVVSEGATARVRTPASPNSMTRIRRRVGKFSSSTAISPREKTSWFSGAQLPRVSSTRTGRNAQDECKSTSLPFMERLTFSVCRDAFGKINHANADRLVSTFSRLRKRRSSLLFRDRHHRIETVVDAEMAPFSGSLTSMFLVGSWRDKIDGQQFPREE